MITPILISIIILLLGLIGGAALWLALRHRQPAREITPSGALPFHWSYIILPLAILLLSIILTAYFYRLLPTEVAYHFKLDGSPDRWLSRERITIWLLGPQLLLTLVAGAITWGITRLSVLFRQPESTWIKPGRILVLMGNMIALPQIILGFAMLDIFSYNSFQIHIMPLWVFALIIMGLGGIIIGRFFIQAVWRAWQATR
ncbi:DUF1648 domain-containing protein [Chloroflexota bacterium]